MNQVARTTRQTTAPALREEHIDRISAAAEASHSPATLRNYAAAWDRFLQWTDREGLVPLPAAPETVAAYLAERAEGLSVASVRMDAAAIRHGHGEAGHANPCAGPGVRRVLRGLTRTAAAKGRAPVQAAPLTLADLAAITATAERRRTGPSGRTETRGRAVSRGRVDVALVAVMRDAMLRRSEAAAIRWADVKLRRDGSARVTVRRSKTDQTGEGAVLYIGKAAAAALRAIQPGDAFTGARRVFGLKSGRSVCNRIRSAARGARLTGNYSGHSPRVGMAVDLAASGVGLPALQVAGRWKSPTMPGRYAAGELAARGAVARFHGEG